MTVAPGAAGSRILPHRCACARYGPLQSCAVCCSLCVRRWLAQFEEAKLARLPTALAMRVGEDPKFTEMKKVLLIQVSSTVAARFL